MSGMGGGGMKVPRIIANIESTGRAQYLTPDAVSGDQNLYARQYREEIRTALAVSMSWVLLQVQLRTKSRVFMEGLRHRLPVVAVVF